MSVLLLTIDEVAKILHCSARTVKRRGITYVRSGNKRLYDPADVEAWRDSSKCHSSDVRARRSGTPKSRSAALGWSDLQARATSGKRSSVFARFTRSAEPKLGKATAETHVHHP